MRSGAAPLRTGSSPGHAAAGSPCGSDHHGVEPSRGWSAASSSALLRWRSSSSRYRPRYHLRCFQRCRSCRNGRSQSATVIESSGGPWPGKRRRAVVDGRGEGEMDVQKRAGSSLFTPLLRVSLSTQLPLMTTGYCECFLGHLKLLF